MAVGASPFPAAFPAPARSRGVKALAAAALLALVGLAGCADDVRTRIYAYNATGEPAELAVRIEQADGDLVVDEAMVVMPGEEGVEVGRIDGPVGNYTWWVSFGPRTYQTTGWIDDGMTAMNLNLLRNRLEISFEDQGL